MSVHPGRVLRSLAALLFCVSLLAPLPAAQLPAHRPLRILIVSDEVNPHGLSDSELTQPGDLSAALNAPGAGVVLDPAPDAVLEIATNEIETATALLELPADDPAAYDVLIYFAHRIPNNGADAAGRQAAFVAAVDGFLTGGGGMVSFHHGSYLTAGKESMVELIGASAVGAVPWDTVEGQNVINVAPGHFVTGNGVSYDTSGPYSDPTRGVPPGTYESFSNVPDERYPLFEIDPAAGPIEMLFGSDYDQNGTAHVLGVVHRRAAWQGRVVVYQPGEYEPNALDVQGNNFQVLANAIVYSADAFAPDPIDLRVSAGPGASAVTLDWAGSAFAFAVHRAVDPAVIDQPASQLGSTSGTTWQDSPPAVPIVFYRIVALP